MHITLTGNLGSGKSTVCKLLEQQYEYEIFSTGKVIRQIADDMNISVLEMNELMTKDHKYDTMIDDKTSAISRENPDKNILFDSRLAWHFVERSFKVFLSVDLDEAARRVYADSSRGEVETYKDTEDAKTQLAARADNEDKRYEDLYGIHYFDFNNYNLVLDSSYASPEIIAKVLMKEARKRADEEPEVRGRLLISPKRLGYDLPEEPTELCDKVCDGRVVVRVDGNRFTVVEGADVVKWAAKRGFAYVAATLYDPNAEPKPNPATELGIDAADIDKYKDMLRYVKTCLEGSGRGEQFKNDINYSRFDHTKRVLSWAMRLYREYEDKQAVDLDALIVATIFHDVSYSTCRDMRFHGQESAEIARKKLPEYGYSGARLDEIAALIAGHQDKYLLPDGDISPALVLLMEADWLDDMGAMGIIMDAWIEHAKNPEADFYDMKNHVEQYTLRQQRENNILRTPAGRRFWDEKTELTEAFFRSLSRDMEEPLGEP